MKGKTAVVGVSDHCGWAVLVTVADDGTLIDRRRVDLVESKLPKLPHHHEAQALPLAEAVKLVERVRTSAEALSGECLESLESSLPMKVTGITLRRCPPLPPTITERLADYRSQNVADTVMYRVALAEAASSRGWAVHWFDPRKVFVEAANALALRSIEEHLTSVGKSVGSPWQKDHRLAMAAAIAVKTR